MNYKEMKTSLLANLTNDQKSAVKSKKRRLLVVAGAGSGKTEVMARRIAWWVGVEGVSKDEIVAFTFTERAADEMRFRIRKWMQRITQEDQEVSLGEMYVGTIHGFCLAKLREYWPDEYHNFDILDEGARTALVLRAFNNLLGLPALRTELGLGQFATIDAFLQTYDQLHEHDRFQIKLPADAPPQRLGADESKWCKKASLVTNVGKSGAAKAFAMAAARYYAYLRCRRFLDFSTSQSEFVRRLRADPKRLASLKGAGVHLVVDEVQDINPIQRELAQLLVQNTGVLTVVGDHRQSIYGFRGAKVEILGELWQEFKKSPDSGVIDLKANFRSTPGIITLANKWSNSITQVGAMTTAPMTHGSKHRQDGHASHIALIDFSERDDEARWIADAINVLVPSEKKGAKHDKRDGTYRGLALSDIAILVRSSTDVRTYMRALEKAGIPSVVRAGPDLFSQPEVLLFIAALAITGGRSEFLGSEHNPKSLPNRIASVLECEPKPEFVLKRAAAILRKSGLSFDLASERRLFLASLALHERIANGNALLPKAIEKLRTPGLRQFLTSKNNLRRIFPQQLFHFLLSEASVDSWDTGGDRGRTALFHLGALSGLITGIETPGWTSVSDYPWQIIGLCQFGAEEGRVEEQPLIVKPEAVTISTIHSVKGLEFAAVFLADVNSSRFPSGFARRKPKLPLEGNIVKEIDVAGLADNENHDGERRLMYVALTRAERFLFISHSGSKTSKFIKELKDLVPGSGGIVTDDSRKVLNQLKYLPKEYRREHHLSTSFSDLRYYLECPHDFYLRKVLGFSPTIDQAFGYGRGVHNLMRAIHSEPEKWAILAQNKNGLQQAIQKLIDRGLFYLRYTTGEPADNMRKKGLEIVATYVKRYEEELRDLDFEPERAFETLIDYEDQEGGALISGAIDIVRYDDPPRVTIIDFKSGDPLSDNHQKLDEEEMKLQVAIYAVGAKKELEYEPEKGIVRYLSAEKPEDAELRIPLDAAAIKNATSLVAKTAARIRDRKFREGPTKSNDKLIRCDGCDFTGICGMEEAVAFKKSHPKDW